MSTQVGTDRTVLHDVSDDDLEAERERRRLAAAEERRAQKAADKAARKERRAGSRLHPRNWRRKNKDTDSSSEPKSKRNIWLPIIAIALVLLLALQAFNAFFRPTVNDQMERLQQQISELTTQVEQLEVGPVNQEDLPPGQSTQETSQQGGSSPPMDLQDEKTLAREIREAARNAQNSESENAVRSAQQAIDDWLVNDMGFAPGEYRLDGFQVDPTERGNTSFSNAPIATREALVEFLNSNDERAVAAREEMQRVLSPEDYERFLSGEGHTLVQFTVPAQYEGNSYFKNGEAVFYTTARPVEAGDMIWVYTNTQGQVVEQGNVRADCGNVRAERVVPRTPVTKNERPETQQPTPAPPVSEQPPTVTTPPTVIPPVTTPPVTTPPVVTPPTTEVPETPEVPKTPKCPYNPDLPEGSPDCKPPAPPHDECPDMPDNQPEGTLCKAPGTPGGAEEQSVQDNDPKHTAPTEGHTAGDAEQNNEEQGSPCSGTSCDLDSTQSGTEVEDSKQGGKAPGGDVVTPSEQQSDSEPSSGQSNPDYDGTAPTQNPDEGTSDPVDTPVSDETAPAGSDPLEGVDLPNVE